MLKTLTIFLPFIFGNAYALDNDPISNLEKEPLTMLEWGTYKIERDLSQGITVEPLGQMDSMTSLQWFRVEKNLNLAINTSVYLPSEIIKKQDLSATCKAAIKAVQDNFLMDSPIEFRRVTGISRYFRKVFFEETEPHLNDALERRTTIYLTVRHKVDSAYPTISKFSAKLNDYKPT